MLYGRGGKVPPKTAACQDAGARERKRIRRWAFPWHCIAERQHSSSRVHWHIMASTSEYELEFTTSLAAVVQLERAKYEMEGMIGCTLFSSKEEARRELHKMYEKWCPDP